MGRLTKIMCPECTAKGIRRACKGPQGLAAHMRNARPQAPAEHEHSKRTEPATTYQETMAVVLWPGTEAGENVPSRLLGPRF
jgi:hypothetical protein